MNNQLLDVDKLKVTIDDRILKESVSFKLFSGDILRIKGSNGSGKTTLMRHILGLYSSSSGKIDFGFEFKLGDTIGYFPQNWQHTLLPWLSAWGNFALGLANHNDNKNINGLLKLAHTFFPNRITNSSEDSPLIILHKILSDWDILKMSGGEQEKIVLLRTVVNAPKILFLDEPFRDLDFSSTKSLIECINTIINDNKSALVFISHQEVNISPTLELNMD